MKIAIFHDYFGAIGGGEKVVIEMAKILDADIITTDTDAVAKIDPGVRVLSLGRTLKYPGLKQISAALKFYFCDFSKKYDLFIFSGNWAHYAAHRHHPNIWYCHTPVRAFYDNYEIFSSSLPFLKRQLFHAYVSVFRWLDKKSISKIDRIIANSKNIRNRIQQYLTQESVVIYPPVITENLHFTEYGNFWLSVNRLYPEKQIGLQIESFRNMPDERLVIAGGYAQGDHSSGYVKKINENYPSNVSFLGEVQDTELVELYARCKGLICTANNEDFGLTPLEAMAAGKPIVAVDSGGYRETVTEQTGILVKADVYSIVLAVREISRDPARYKNACLDRAKQFDIEIFREKIRDIIKP